jgi:predicted PurR-regulated permease PerM
MNLTYLRNLNKERKLALIFGAFGFILTFRLNSLPLFIGLTVFSGLIGYLLGYTNQRIKKRIHRYPVYLLLVLLFTVPILAVFYTQLQGCLANMPYEAKNIFTGETKTFIHGGCGARTEHPWYYRITDTNA